MKFNATETETEKGKYASKMSHFVVSFSVSMKIGYDCCSNKDINLEKTRRDDDLTTI